MTPYFQNDTVAIYHGDTEEVCQSLGVVDIVVTSPPYNTISKTQPSGLFKEHQRKQNAGYRTYSDDMPESEYADWMRRLGGIWSDMTKGLVWINHKTRFREKQGIHPSTLFALPFHSEIVWDRGGSLTLNAKRFAPSHEFIYGFGAPHYWDNSINTKMTVWRINPETSIKWHVCPFPPQIPERLIVASCPEGGIVLDPFMGSGTTQ